jgi:hypothetical protein
MSVFSSTSQGAYLIRAWEWLHWAYTRAIPVQIVNLKDASRRDLRG